MIYQSFYSDFKNVCMYVCVAVCLKRKQRVFKHRITWARFILLLSVGQYLHRCIL